MFYGESHKGICTFFRQIHVARQSQKNLLNLLGILFFHMKDPVHSNIAILCVQKTPAVCNFVEPASFGVPYLLHADVIAYSLL